MEPTVVAGFDPESSDRAPIDLAVTVARLLRARLLAVVVRPGGAAAERLARVEPGGAQDPRALATLEGVRREGGEPRVVEAPSASAGLHAVLEMEQPALAVLGSAARADYGRVLPGSTAQRLLGGAPCPLAVVPRGYAPRRPAAVAVAVLPSPEGRAALALAATLALAMDVPLRALMVLSRSPDVDEAAILARELLPVGDRGPVIDSGIFVGDPVDTLLRTSAHVDLLVLGSRAYGPAGAVLAGGVARRVLAGARCPVIVVPRAPAAVRSGPPAPAEAVTA